MPGQGGIPRELRPLVDAAKKNGYKVLPAGRAKHLRVIDPKGKVVVDAQGPVIVSSTPSEHRHRDMHVQRWIAAGIITADQNPWKPQKAKEGENGQPETRSEEEERLLAAKKAEIAEQDRARANRTKKIRERLEPIIARLGGWEKRGLQADMGRVLFRLSRGWTGAPKNENSAGQLITRIKRGDTLGEGSAECLERLLKELENHEDLVLHWTNLVRESKDLPKLTALPPAKTEPEPEPEPGLPPEPEELLPGPHGSPAERYGGLSVIERRRDMEHFDLPRKPELAILVMAEMMRGQPADVDVEPLVELAMKVQELEMGR